MEMSERENQIQIQHHLPALWRINNWQAILMSSIAGLKKHPTPDSWTPLHKTINTSSNPHSLYIKFKFTSRNILWCPLRRALNVRIEQTSEAIRETYKMCRVGGGGALETGIENRCCMPMTAHLKTPLSSSWSLQTTPHWSASSRTVTSLLTDRRLRSWLPGAVLTTWSLTRSKLWRWLWTSGETPLLCPHSPSWTALWLQWSHSDSWVPPSPRTWSGTFT